MWGRHTFRAVVFILIGVMLTPPQPACAANTTDNVKIKKSRTAKKSQLTTEALPPSVREQALRALEAVPVGALGATPQIMMPLNDEYKVVPRRAWEWMIETSLANRSVDIPVAQGTLGPARSRDLSALTFLELGAGLSKHFGRFHLALLGRGATAVKQTDYALPSGAKLPLRYQWISYGVEPRLAWNFSGRTSLFAAILGEQVSFIQSSSQSELLQGTQSFRENATRLGLTYDIDGNAYALVAVKNFSNDYFSGSAVSVGVGAKW